MFIHGAPRHGWSNRSDRNCRICFVLIDGEFDEALRP